MCACVCSSMTVNAQRRANLQLTSWVGLFPSAASSKQLPRARVCERDSLIEEEEEKESRLLFVLMPCEYVFVQ